MLDLAIRNGWVVDGTGAPRRQADVGVLDGRVVRVGQVDDPAREEIDATGRIVAPGFVDVHTHYDAQAFWDPTLSPSALHGVTTVIGGNCGFSIAPLRPEENDGEYLSRMLATVEGMPLESLQAGLGWDWTSTADFLDRLDGTLAVNAGFMVGHSALRRAAMGADAVGSEATAEQVATMQALLADGLEAGGLGFSSSWGPSHLDGDGKPVPSRWATTDELTRLAGVCRRFAGTSLEFIPSQRPFTATDVEVMVGMSRAAERALNWNMLLVDAKTLGEAEDALAVDDAARRSGGRVVALTMPVPILARYSFRTGFVLGSLPGWSEAMSLSPPEKLVLLSDPFERRRLEEQAAQGGRKRAFTDWGSNVILETFTPETEPCTRRRVADIAAEEGKTPFDALLDIVCADELRTLFAPLPVERSEADWKAMREVWRDGRAVIGASDAGAHLDFIDTFCYPTWLLSDAVRRNSVIGVEEAVHLISQVPAYLYGLKGRGVLTEGAAADIVVFDEAEIGTGEIVTRFDLPMGAGRLYSEATGVDHVLVNGRPIVAKGSFTPERPGCLLRSGKDTGS